MSNKSKNFSKIFNQASDSLNEPRKVLDSLKRVLENVETLVQGSYINLEESYVTGWAAKNMKSEFEDTIL